MVDVISDRLSGQLGSLSLHYGIEHVPIMMQRLGRRKDRSNDKIQSLSQF